MTKSHLFLEQLTRIADALEQISHKPAPLPDFNKTKGFLWEGETRSFIPVEEINHIASDFLIGIEPQKQKLLANTESFAKNLPANNALLWGARGMGKSSLVKAIHHELTENENYKDLKLIEILREDIITLNDCLAVLKKQPFYFILFCDDLSFEPNDPSYKSLKALLEGGIAGRPKNVIFYATSNQRHLLTRDQSEYAQTDYIHTNDVSNEKISLSDRFGLWLGFHNCDKAQYDEMVTNYAHRYGIKLSDEEVIKRAHLWSMERGSRSGRVAMQFIQHLLGDQQISI